MDIQQIVKQSLNWKFLHLLFKRHNNIFLGGQAIILTSQLFGMNIIDDMLILLRNRRTNKAAISALFLIERMKYLNDPLLTEEISRYSIKYNFSTKTISQRALKKISRLHPSPADAQVLPLPKSLHFLYFPLQPYFWLRRKSKQLVFSKGDLK